MSTHGSIEISVKTQADGVAKKIKEGKIEDAEAVIASVSAEAPPAASSYSTELVTNALIAAESPDQIVRAKAENILAAAPKAYLQAAPAVTLVSHRKARVYIQVPAGAGWEKVFTPAARKEHAGRYIIPGVEAVSSAPLTTEVRFFNPARYSDAVNIVDALRTFGITDATASLQTATGADIKSSPDINSQIEVWVGSKTPLPVK